MTIHLPPDIERSIQAAVHSGHFAWVDHAMILTHDSHFTQEGFAILL